MATNVAAFRARLLDERAAVVAEIATIDVPAEQNLFDAAAAVFATAQAQFDKATVRWTLVNEKLERLPVLDAQIAIVTP